MAADISNPVIGSLVFAGIKVAGYSFAATRLNRLYSASVNPWLFGITRTLLGVAVGAALGYLLVGAQKDLDDFYLALVPIRIFEWLVLIALFYDRQSPNLSRLFKAAALGTLLSFALDIPAGLLGVLSAGVFIC